MRRDFLCFLADSGNNPASHILVHLHSSKETQTLDDVFNHKNIGTIGE